VSAPRRQNVIAKAVELVAQIYRYSGAGCCWHVVLDDGNWDSLDFCRKWARDRIDECKTHGACLELAALDVSSSILSRAKRRVMAMHEEERRTRFAESLRP
jgi:hypothetical protein